MEEETLKLIQRYLQDVPLLVLGSGSSIPHGIPGMGKLAEHIDDHLTTQFPDDDAVREFKKYLLEGVGLEIALQKVRLRSELHDSVIMSTWEYINDADQSVFEQYLVGGEKLPLADPFASED